MAGAVGVSLSAGDRCQADHVDQLEAGAAQHLFDTVCAEAKVCDLPGGAAASSGYAVEEENIEGLLEIMLIFVTQRMRQSVLAKLL